MVVVLCSCEVTLDYVSWTVTFGARKVCVFYSVGAGATTQALAGEGTKGMMENDFGDEKQ